MAYICGTKATNMTTLEILSAFMKGYEKVSISDKQRNWLLSQARAEGVAHTNDGFSDTLYFDDCHYQVRHCKRLASGGSYVGSRIVQGRYNIEKLYYIKFDSTGLTSVCSLTDIKYYRTTEHTFQIISLKSALAV